MTDYTKSLQVLFPDKSWSCFDTRDSIVIDSGEPVPSEKELKEAEKQWDSLYGEKIRKEREKNALNKTEIIGEILKWIETQEITPELQSMIDKFK